MDEQRGWRTLSRRELLSKSTYGLGAALLLGPGLPQVVPDRPMTPEKARSRGRRTGRAVYRAPLSTHGQPRAVCKGDAGVLVMGATDDGSPVGWLTADGSSWHEHTLPTPLDGENDLWGVAAHAGRYIAVGSIVHQELKAVSGTTDVPGDDMDVTFTVRRRLPAVWWTTDCTTWSSRVLGDTAGTHAQLIAIACERGMLVAVGSVLDADGVQGAGGLVLVSTDGRNWEAAELDVAFAEGSFTAVTAAGGRWFATSTDMNGGAVWTSDDGRRWSPIRSSMDVFRGIALQGIAVKGRRVLVAGTPLTEPSPRYFVSSDGAGSWIPLALDLQRLSGSDALVADLKIISGDVVVVGTHKGVPVIEGGELDGRH